MKRSPLSILILLGSLACGCHGGKEYYFHSANDVKRFKQSALEIDYPNVESEATPEVRLTAAPRTLEELRTTTRFIQVTAASVQESHPHDIAITQEAPNYSSADYAGDAGG